MIMSRASAVRRYEAANERYERLWKAYKRHPGRLSYWRVRRAGRRRDAAWAAVCPPASRRKKARR